MRKAFLSIAILLSTLSFGQKTYAISFDSVISSGNYPLFLRDTPQWKLHLDTIKTEYIVYFNKRGRLRKIENCTVIHKYETCSRLLYGIHPNTRDYGYLFDGKYIDILLVLHKYPSITYIKNK